MDDDHDPADVSHWPEEFLIASEDDAETRMFSLALVRDGLKSGDLEPLAKHLRNGLPIPDEIANLIADAIERKPGAVCTISARRPSRGAPHLPGGKLHTRYLDIAFAAERALLGTKRTQHRQILFDLKLTDNCRESAHDHRLSPAIIKKARAYMRAWIANLPD